MRLTYKAKIKQAEDGWSVSFPDLPAVLTCGDTLDEALNMAKEALNFWLEYALDENMRFSMPEYDGEGYDIPVAGYIAFPVVVRDLRKKQGLTQVELAKKLGVGQATAQAYERPDRNRKMSTVETVLSKLGYEAYLSFEKIA